VPRWAIAAALAAVAAALLAVLALGEHRTVLGVNGTPAAEFVAVVGPGGVLCQRGLAVPPEAGRVQLFTGDFGRRGSPFLVKVRTPDGTTQGTVPAGWAPERATARLRGTLPATSRGGVVCLRNRGLRRFAVAGIRGIPPDGSLTLDGRALPARIQVVWLRAQDATWLAMADELAPQVGRLKSDVASWWVALLGAVVMTGLVGTGLRRL
jgi:hypothetical protein